jgi:hypothetical protein
VVATEALRYRPLILFPEYERPRCPSRSRATLRDPIGKAIAISIITPVSRSLLAR